MMLTKSESQLAILIGGHTVLCLLALGASVFTQNFKPTATEILAFYAGSLISATICHILWGDRKDAEDVYD